MLPICLTFSAILAQSTEERNTIGRLPPMYLRQEGFPHCFSTHQTGHTRSYCIPNKWPSEVEECKEEVHGKLLGHTGLGVPRCDESIATEVATATEVAEDNQVDCGEGYVYVTDPEFPELNECFPDVKLACPTGEKFLHDVEWTDKWICDEGGDCEYDCQVCDPAAKEAEIADTETTRRLEVDEEKEESTDEMEQSIAHNLCVFPFTLDHSEVYNQCTTQTTGWSSLFSTSAEPWCLTGVNNRHASWWTWWVPFMAPKWEYCASGSQCMTEKSEDERSHKFRLPCLGRSDCCTSNAPCLYADGECLADNQCGTYKGAHLHCAPDSCERLNPKNPDAFHNGVGCCDVRWFHEQCHLPKNLASWWDSSKQATSSTSSTEDQEFGVHLKVQMADNLHFCLLASKQTDEVLIVDCDKTLDFEDVELGFKLVPGKEKIEEGQEKTIFQIRTMYANVANEEDNNTEVVEEKCLDDEPLAKVARFTPCQEEVEKDSSSERRILEEDQLDESGPSAPSEKGNQWWMRNEHGMIVNVNSKRALGFGVDSTRFLGHKLSVLLLDKEVVDADAQKAQEVYEMDDKLMSEFNAGDGNQSKVWEVCGGSWCNGEDYKKDPSKCGKDDPMTTPKPLKPKTETKKVGTKHNATAKEPATSVDEAEDPSTTPRPNAASALVAGLAFALGLFSF